MLGDELVKHKSQPPSAAGKRKSLAQMKAHTLELPHPSSNNLLAASGKNSKSSAEGSGQSGSDDDEDAGAQKEVKLIELVPRNKQPKSKSGYIVWSGQKEAPPNWLNDSDCSDSCTENEKDAEEAQGEPKEEDDEEQSEEDSDDDDEDAISEASNEDDVSDSNESKADDADAEDSGQGSGEGSDDQEEGSGEDEESESKQDSGEDAGDDEEPNHDDSSMHLDNKLGVDDSNLDKDAQDGKGGQQSARQNEHEILLKKFIRMEIKEPKLEEMIAFSTQNYQFVKGYKDLLKAKTDLEQELELTDKRVKESFENWVYDRIRDFQLIGSMSNRSKALVYALQEVEMMTKPELDAEIKKRKMLRNNPLTKWYIDRTLIFTNYLAKPWLFQKRFNPYLLFMLSNSQDELLLAYTDFCKAKFQKGLPDKATGTLPKSFTSVDLAELKSFVQREALTENQFKLAFAKNIDENPYWKETAERDLEGKPISLLSFEEAVPYIIVGFFCYITNEAEQRLARIANTDGAVVVDHDADPISAAKRNSHTSLAACFERAGLKREEWHQRVVSYSMTENALLFYTDKNTINTDQVELVLRMVRERMDVHPMIRTETKMEYFDHKLPRKSFGRWLMSELALVKRMRELATDQSNSKKCTRDHFRRQLVYEEKMMHTAVNMEKLDYGRFTNMVTKNLLIIVHARKKFGAFLDLDNHGSIKEALMALIKQESEKAVQLLDREYQPMAQAQINDVARLKAELDEQKEKANRPLPGGGQPPPFQIQKTFLRRNWEKRNKKITEEYSKLKSKVSVANIYKLFNSSLYQTYWHTFFRNNKLYKQHKTVHRQLERDYEGPTNLTHYTVQEFNEAVFFAIREFSNYVNFHQVESATFYYIMDQLLAEKNREGQKLGQDKLKDNFNIDPRKKVEKKVEYDRSGKPIEDDGTKDIENETSVYPINQNGPKKLTAYSSIFVNHNTWKDIKGEPKKKVYQDRLDEKGVTQFLRKRDLEKLKKIENFGRNVVQSEVELFRNFKLADLEFTRYAFQILMEEAHRRSIHMMGLMFLSTKRSKFSHKPEEQTVQEKAFDDKNDVNKPQLLAAFYEKFKSNPVLKKRELAQVREQFRDQRIQRLRSKKQSQMEKNASSIFGGTIPTGLKVREVRDSDLHHPLNHVGYERFRAWLKQQTQNDYSILSAKQESNYGETHPKFEQRKKEMYEQHSKSYHFAKDELDDAEGGGKKQPIESKVYDMSNILLSLNYFTGFGATIIEASKKIEDDEEDKEGQKEEHHSRQGSDSGAEDVAQLSGDSDGDEKARDRDKNLLEELETFLRDLKGEKDEKKETKIPNPLRASAMIGKEMLQSGAGSLGKAFNPGVSPINQKINDGESEVIGFADGIITGGRSNPTNTHKETHRQRKQRKRDKHLRPNFQFNIDKKNSKGQSRTPINDMLSDEESNEHSEHMSHGFGKDNQKSLFESQRKKEKLLLIDTSDKKHRNRYQEGFADGNSEGSADFRMGRKPSSRKSQQSRKAEGLGDRVRKQLQVNNLEDSEGQKRSKRSGSSKFEGSKFADRVMRMNEKDDLEQGKSKKRSRKDGGETAGAGATDGGTPGDGKNCVIF